MRETIKGSYVEFIGNRMLQHEQNGCTVLFTRLQSTNIFFSILIGGLDIGLAKNIINLIYLDIGVAKNMQGMLCKWMPQDKYFKYQNFPTYFLLSLFLECFSEI